MHKWWVRATPTALHAWIPARSRPTRHQPDGMTPPAPPLPTGSPRNAVCPRQGWWPPCNVHFARLGVLGTHDTDRGTKLGICYLLHPRATTGSGVHSFPATRIAPTHRTRPTPLASSFRHAQLEDAQHAQLGLLEASGDEATWTCCNRLNCSILSPSKRVPPVTD